MAILVPTCCQKVPNLTPRSPKRAQIMAKIAQESPTYGQDRSREPNLWPRSPKILPKSLQPDPPRPQNVAKTLYYGSIFDFHHCVKCRSQDHQKCSKKLLKWPQDGHLGPNLEALGAILAPSWRHLAPFGRDFGRSEPGQN